MNRIFTQNGRTLALNFRFSNLLRGDVDFFAAAK